MGIESTLAVVDERETMRKLRSPSYHDRTRASVSFEKRPPHNLLLLPPCALAPGTTVLDVVDDDLVANDAVGTSVAGVDEDMTRRVRCCSDPNDEDDSDDVRRTRPTAVRNIELFDKIT